MKISGKLVHRYTRLPESKKSKKKTLKLKELDDFGIFFKKFIHQGFCKIREIREISGNFILTKISGENQEKRGKNFTIWKNQGFFFFLTRSLEFIFDN